MQVVKTFDTVPLDVQASRHITREAVRAVVFNEQQEILLMYAKKLDAVKFPGGGIEANESHGQALQREMLEETGYEVVDDPEPVGMILQRNLDKQLAEEKVVFQMSSYYYRAVLSGRKTQISLSASEQAMALEACWMPLEFAIAKNQAYLNRSVDPLWVPRETWMLQYLVHSIT